MMTAELTVGSLLEHAERYHANTPIISIAADGVQEQTNWKEIAVNARKLGSALQKLGLNPSDCCGTIAWNNRRHLEIYYGVPSSGHVCHTINPRLSDEDLAYVVNTAQDRVLFFDTTFAPQVARLQDQLKTVEHFVLLGSIDELAQDTRIEKIICYNELLETGSSDFNFPRIGEQTASSLCFTSGTTGKPKGVLYSHRSTVLHSLAGNQPDGFAISAKDTVLPVVPMFHVNAWGVPFIAAAVGCKLLLPGPFLDGKSLIDLMNRERATMAFGVPAIWMGLLEELRRSGQKLKTLKRSVVGGSALAPSMQQAFLQGYDVDLIHAWGMTETSPVGTINQLLNKHISLPAKEQQKIRISQGRPPYGVELRLTDDQNKPLPNGSFKEGNLQIRGHWIARSYLNEKRSSLTDDAWFDTGDIATINADGFLTIKDRSKDIIKSGGEWISTVELENIALTHPKISNAAAIAAKHPKWDERPIIIACPTSGDISEAEILGYFRTKLAKWQMPERIIFVDQLPLGATGKVLKNKLRDKYGSSLMEP